MVSEELLLSIPVTGGELKAIRGADLCDGPEPVGGPVALFLHGAAFNAATWVETGTHQLLCEVGIPSISIDLPGLGRSSRFNHDRAQLLDDIVAYVADTVIVVSPSMSGNYAIPWLMTNPIAAAGFVPVAPVGIGSWTTPNGFNVPTLGIWGSEDRTVPVAEGERLIASIPGARLDVIDGAAMPCTRQAPKSFTRRSSTRRVAAVTRRGGRGESATAARLPLLVDQRLIRSGRSSASSRPTTHAGWPSCCGRWRWPSPR